MIGTERTKPDWPPLGDVVDQGGYSLTAETLEDPSPPGFFTHLEPGFRLVSVELVLGNVSGADHSSSPIYASLVDTDGFVYAAGLFGRDEGVLEVVTLRAGDRTRGWVSFVVPDASVPESVKYKFDLFTNLTLQAGLTSP
jgi:hypothetical protein